MADQELTGEERLAAEQLTGEELREEQIVSPAASAAPAATVAVDGLAPLDDGSVAASLGAGAVVAAGERPGLKHYLPSMSGKLVTGLVITAVIVLFAVVAPFFTLDPHNSDYDAMLSPRLSHPLGTTALGYDVLAQLAQGARGSLFVGLIVGLITLVLSVLFGIVGGYLGGWSDEALSLLTNIMLVIPGLPLTVVISSYATHKSVWLVALVLGVTGWAASAVVLRSQTRSLRSRDYVAASRVAGEKPLRIIAVEILPNLLPLVAAQFLFAIIFAILGEAGLSYLGLGPSSAITWGTMLNDAQSGQGLSRGAWWWFVPPGLLIALLGCGLSLINFAIDEIINPKLRATPAAAKSVRKARRGARASVPAVVATTEEAGA